MTAAGCAPHASLLAGSGTAKGRRGRCALAKASEQLRDLAYADDVVAAFLAAAETLLGTAPERCAGQAFNLGGDAPVSLLRLAELLVDAAGLGSYEIRSLPPDRAAIYIGSYHADDRAVREAPPYTAPPALCRVG